MSSKSNATQLKLDPENITSTTHRLIIGSCEDMSEIEDDSIQLMVTSPPYYNAPFDYEDLYSNYESYLDVIEAFARETYRVLEDGRIAVVNTDDMLVRGEKFPIVADTTKVFQKAGFRYRDRIVWKKPDGYLRISRRSGVLLQNPYPMYYYPDNLLESILIFQKGRFNYKSKTKEQREDSKIDKEEFQNNDWYMTLWKMTNVLPGSKLEKNIAAFPDELPYRIIRLFSYKGETVLDPFVGSGTTMKVARELGRNSVGYEILPENEEVIKIKIGVDQPTIDFGDNDAQFSVIRKSKTG